MPARWIVTAKFVYCDYSFPVPIHDSTMSMTAPERAARIQQIRELPASVRAAVDGLTDTQLDTPYRPGGWTVRQVVHHLADSHLNAFVRMKLILTESRPTLKPYDQNAWALLRDSAAPLPPSLAILDGLHARWTLLLDGVGEDQWSRAAVHPESGEVTLETLLKTYSNHCANHLGQITGLKKARGW